MKVNDQGKAYHAFTLIECLIILLLIGLLISLTLPAVLDARGASRRTQCTNNLRQIGIGLHQFEAQQGRFPGVFAGLVNRDGMGGGMWWSFSPSGKISSYIGGDPIANNTSFYRSPTDDLDWSDLGCPSPAILRCPEDSLSAGESSNYRYCRGVIPTWPKDSGGSFIGFDGFRASEITDGLSHTAFSSERLVSNPEQEPYDRNRNVISIDPTKDLVSACLHTNNNWLNNHQIALSDEGSGTSWLSGICLQASYYHLFPPNSSFMDCHADNMEAISVVSARSYHNGGVNVLFGDGHVDFVANTVNLAVWRAMATRAAADSTQEGH